MGEVVPAHTLLTLHPPSPLTVLSLFCLKFHSASIDVTNTVRVNNAVAIVMLASPVTAYTLDTDK